jgi:hypothetical protein
MVFLTTYAGEVYHQVSDTRPPLGPGLALPDTVSTDRLVGIRRIRGY